MAQLPEPWLIHFFQRHYEEDPARSTPTIDFLNTLPDAVAAEIQAVLEAVAAAPPPSFSGGGKWEAMHGEMAGIYEVRVHGGRANHRLFCLLERNGDDLGGSAIICLGGLTNLYGLRPVRGTTSASSSSPTSFVSVGLFIGSRLWVANRQVQGQRIRQRDDRGERWIR